MGELNFSRLYFEVRHTESSMDGWVGVEKMKEEGAQRICFR
jgi:hypothetical protein